MSSKRARRAKRKKQFKEYDPEKFAEMNKKPEAEEESEPEVVRLPGQRWVRIGSALLLVGGLLTALVNWYALNNIKDISAEDFINLTSAYGQTPMLYVTTICLTSVAAVFQLAFGYTIFRNTRNPFYAKRTIVMCCILIAIEVMINLYVMLQSTTGFQIMTLFYGCIIPLGIIYGAYKNMKFAEAHPDYVPPEPTQMF